MRTKTTLVFALLFALAGAIPGAAQADWDDRVDPGEFESELAPHGYWVDEARFGRVWRPYVEWDWRPYSAGQWIWSPYGWTWSSYEPWSWTFHYGRWGWSSLYGWVWTPGSVWGPAWVDWFWGDGYVGWAPLGPAGFALVPSYWSYVNVYNFCAPRVNTVFVHERRLPDYIVHHRDNGWGRSRAPDFRDVEVVSRHRIDRENERRPDSIAPWVHRRTERGERVQERVFDGRSERVIEHARRPDARPDTPPRVVDDGGWRRGGRERNDGLVHGGRRDGGRPEIIVPDRRIDREPPSVMRRGRDLDDEADVPPPLRHEGAPGDDGRGNGRAWGHRPEAERPRDRGPVVDRPPVIIDRRGGREVQVDRPRHSTNPGWSRGAPPPQTSPPRVIERSAPMPPPSGFGGGGGVQGGGMPRGGVPMEHGGGGRGGGEHRGLGGGHQ